MWHRKPNVNFSYIHSALSDTSHLPSVPSVNHLMRTTLDNILESELNRFKYILTEKSTIPLSALETAGRDDVVYKMHQCFVEKSAEVMVNILLEMNKNQLATDLKRDLEKSNKHDIGCSINACIIVYVCHLSCFIKATT